MIETQIPFTRFARHLAVFGLLFLAWRLASEWYLDGRFFFWILAAACAIIACFLASLSLPESFRSVSLLRISIAIGFVLLMLPWAEWLEMTHASSREPWTRQVLQHAMFAYAIFIPLDLFAPARRAIQTAVLWVLDLFSRKILFYLIPILFFALAAYISIRVHKQTPFLQDSAAHLFQAKIFRELHWSAPAPPLSEFFSVTGDMLVIHEGKWFSMYQPGFSMLLAFAMFFSAEWFLSPFLGALTILVWMLYAKRWHGPRIAVLFGLIAIVSPFLLMMSSTIMVYTPELFFASLAIFLSRSATESEKKSWFHPALFIAVAGVMLVRSFSSMLFLSPVFLYSAWATIRKRSFGVALSILCGVILGGSLLMYYQSQTTGNAFLSAYFLEYPNLRIGFGENHTPLRALANLSNQLLSLNGWLTGWYSGALLFLFAFLLFAKKIEKWDLILFGGCLAILIFYLLHAFQDLIIGPRYYYIFAAFLILLVARSASAETLNKEKPGFLLPILAISLISFLPVALPQVISQYNVPQTFPGQLRRELKNAEAAQLLVFLDQSTRPYFVNWNDPFLRGSAIIALNRGDENEKLKKSFPDHHSVYYRADLSMVKLQFSQEFRLFYDPNPVDPGYLSMFQLTLAVDTASKYPDRNIFDVAYDDLLKGDSPAQLKYIQEQLQALKPAKGYKDHFEKGLFHLASLLLLPRVADEQDSVNWPHKFNWDAYRAEFESAASSLVRAGLVGSGVLAELQKVQRRIDRDRDGTLSDPELTRFLKLHLSVFHEFGN